MLWPQKILNWLLKWLSISAKDKFSCFYFFFQWPQKRLKALKWLRWPQKRPKRLKISPSVKVCSISMSQMPFVQECAHHMFLRIFNLLFFHGIFLMPCPSFKLFVISKKRNHEFTNSEFSNSRIWNDAKGLFKPLKWKGKS